MASLDPLYLCVTPIRIQIAGERRLHYAGSATGFFYESGQRRFLITNRHVVIDEEKENFPDSLVIRLHTDRMDLSHNREVTIELYSDSTSNWLEHASGKDVDVVAIEIGQHLTEGDITTFLGPQTFLPPNVVLDLSTDLAVIGYPLGFYDTNLNLPVVRDASLASAYPLAFQDLPICLVDANLHPGTSGSPVIRKSSSTQRLLTESATSVEMGAYPSYLLGVNSGEFTSNQVPLGLHAVWQAKVIEEIISRRYPPVPASSNPSPTPTSGEAANSD